MNSRGSPAKARARQTRPYRSELRQKQAEQTRVLILEAVGRVLSRGEPGQFTMGAVAKEAGVSNATVFRHFDGRESLFEAFVDSGARRFKLLPQMAESIDELPDHIPRLFAFYEDQRELLLATLSTPQLLELNEPSRQRRVKRLEALVSAKHPDIDPKRRNEIVALLQLQFSAHTWRWLTETFGLPTSRAAELVAQQTRNIIDELARSEQRSP